MANNTVTSFPDSASSDNALAQAQANSQHRQALQQSVNPSTVGNAANLQQQYPSLPPDSVLPLAQSGVNANSPGAQDIATAAAKAKVKKGFGWHSVGDFVQAGIHDVGNVIGDAAGGVGHGAKALSDSAFGGVVKPTVRGLVDALSFVPQEMQGVVRTEAQNIHKFGVVGSLAAPFKGNPQYSAGGVEDQTDVGQILNQVKAQGIGKVNTGAGYFPGGTAHTAQARAAEKAWSIAGQAATPGRVLASIVTEPGTMPYNVLSGLVDAGVNWFGDPAAKGLQALGKARLASKLLADGTPVDAEEAFSAAGKGFQADAKAGSQAADVTKSADTPIVSPKPTAMEDQVATNGTEDPWTPTASQEHREASGLVDGLRRTVMPENAANWLQSDNGRKVIQKIADTNSYAELRKTFTNGSRIEPDILNELSKANTPRDVLNVLKPILGIADDSGNLRMAPQLPNTLQRAITNVGEAVFRRDPSTVRLLSDMPGTHIDATNKTDAVNNIEKFLINAKLPQDVIDQHVNAMADTSGPNSVFKATTNAVQAVQEHLVGQAGMPKAAANQMTRMFRDYHQELARYFVDEVGDNYPVLGAKIDGADKALPTPHLFSEYINNSIPLPDARAIRKATSQYGKILNGLQGSDSEAVQKLGAFANGSLEFGSSFLSTITNNIFKPAALLRGAYVTRVIPEEQLRMAASGLDSFASHPISYMAYLTGRKGNLDALGHTFTDDKDAIGDMRDFAAAQTHGSGGWRDRLMQKGRILYDIRDPAYGSARANELEQLNADPLARRIAGGWSMGERPPNGFTGNNMQDAQRWFWSGEGSKMRLQMAQASGREDLENSQAVSDSYVESVAKRLSIKTQDDPKLLNAVAKGSFKTGGKTINVHAGPGKIDNAFKKHLSDLAAQGIGPQKVQGDISLSGGPGAGNKALETWDKAIEYSFNALASVPTNKLDRAPTFKQFYWKRIGELFPYMDKSSQAQVLNSAAKANISADAVDVGHDVSGTLGAKDADAIAKGHALDSTKELLYDMSKKSQFFNILHNVMPFGDAWKEVFDVWSKIGMTNPAVLRRAQQISQEGNQSGFFFQDPTTKQESFKYYGSGFLTDKLLGIPVPLSGSIKGANVFGGVTPGFGPSVQWIASALLPDKPQYDDIRNIITPYGDTDTSNGFLESLFPAWFQKFRQSGDVPLFGRQDDRVWNNTVSNVAKELVSTGKYNTNSPQAINDLFTAAKSKASELYVIRSIAQWGAPSAPTPDFLAKVMGTQQKVYTAGDNVKGLLQAGNLDLNARPIVKNSDGSISTVRSITITQDNGKAVLIPTVVGNKVVSNDDAISHYQQTGENLGTFDNENDADKYAQSLHEEQSNHYANGADAAVHYIMAASMVNDYYNMQKADYKNATSNFIAKYGTDNVLFTQAGSTSSVPATKQAYNWERSHPDLASTYPQVFGLFAPAGASFDPTAELRQFATGERTALTPQQVLQNANNRLGDQIWYTAQAKLKGRTDQQATQLRDNLRDALMKDYPGWSTSSSNNDVPTQINEVQEAMSNKVISNTPAGKATQTYLAARQEIQKIAESRGLTSWTQANSAADLRNAMRQIGSSLVASTPDFGNLWTGVFNREMKSDQSETQ